MEPLVSIILPVYNAGNYLNMAIDSIINQTYKNFELIIIDDGSTDYSSSICKQYMEEDKRIIYYYQQNSGICKSRNIGIQLAVGKYITFCDHDDEFHKELLEIGVHVLEKDNLDFLKFGYSSIIKADASERVFKRIFYSNYSSLDELVQNPDDFNHFIAGIWNGLYKREIIMRNLISFNENMRYGCEDIDFNLQLLMARTHFGTIENMLYTHYTRITQSTSTKYHANRLHSIIQVMQVTMQMLNQCYTCNKYCRNVILEKYIEEYLSVLFFDDCPLSLKEKKQCFLQFRNSIPLLYTLSPHDIMRFYLSDKKKFFIWLLFMCKCYTLILLSKKVFVLKKSKHKK